MEIDYSFMELPIFIRNKNDRSKSNNFIKNGLISFSDGDNYFYEFDEKIFYGLIILANISKSNQFITTYVEILKHSGILYNGATLKKLKDSIQKMKELEIICKELKITENIKKLEIINEISEIRTESKEHVKIHLKITLNKNIYDEISFFNFSILGLLRSTVAKRLLILLKLYVRKEASLLLERRVEELCNIIPLSTAKQNISMSFKYLLDALNEISEIGFVENYEIIKNDRVVNYIIKINVFEKTIEENLIWLLKKVRFEKKIPITSKKEKNEFLLKVEIQNIANELRYLIRDIENILKECDIENRYIIKDILLSVIEKVHAIKGIAKYIYNYEIYDLANEEEKKIVGYLKSKVEIKTSLLREMLIFTNKVSEEVENEDIDS